MLGKALAWLGVAVGKGLVWLAVAVGKGLVWLAVGAGIALAWLAVGVGRALAWLAVVLWRFLRWAGPELGRLLPPLAAVLRRALARGAAVLGRALRWLAIALWHASRMGAVLLGTALVRGAVLLWLALAQARAARAIPALVTVPPVSPWWLRDPWLRDPARPGAPGRQAVGGPGLDLRAHGVRAARRRDAELPIATTETTQPLRALPAAAPAMPQLSAAAPITQPLPAVPPGHAATIHAAAHAGRAGSSRTGGPHPGAGRTGWRPAARVAAALVWAAAGVVLFLCYLRVSRTAGVDSDGASNALQAWDMLHGNPLLRGWRLSDVSFYTTELPRVHAGRAGPGAAAPTWCTSPARMTYTLLVLLAALLAKGRAAARTGLLRAAIAGGIMLAPQLGNGVYVLLLAPDHVGSTVPVMLIWLLLDRAPAPLVRAGGGRGAADLGAGGGQHRADHRGAAADRDLRDPGLPVLRGRPPPAVGELVRPGPDHGRGGRDPARQDRADADHRPRRVHRRAGGHPPRRVRGDAAARPAGRARAAAAVRGRLLRPRPRPGLGARDAAPRRPGAGRRGHLRGAQALRRRPRPDRPDPRRRSGDQPGRLPDLTPGRGPAQHPGGRRGAAVLPPPWPGGCWGRGSSGPG